jgi:hypothetical protein
VRQWVPEVQVAVGCPARLVLYRQLGLATGWFPIGCDSQAHLGEAAPFLGAPYPVWDECTYRVHLFQIQRKIGMFRIAASSLP